MPIDTRLASSLRESLGSESAGQWLQVMDLIGASLPFLLRSAGRPSSKEVASSPIGAAGFTSWRDMVECHPASGGLGWSYDSYKAWKKAYSHVLRHPYLRDLGLSASEINTIAREADEFPDTLDALQAFKAGRKDAQEERRLNSVSALQKQLNSANQALSATQSDLDLSRASEARIQALYDDLRDELSSKTETIGSLQVQLQTATTELDQVKKIALERKKQLDASESAREQAKKTINRYRSMSRLALLLAAWKGGIDQ